MLPYIRKNSIITIESYHYLLSLLLFIYKCNWLRVYYALINRQIEKLLYFF